MSDEFQAHTLPMLRFDPEKLLKNVTEDIIALELRQFVVPWITLTERN